LFHPFGFGFQQVLFPASLRAVPRRNIRQMRAANAGKDRRARSFVRSPTIALAFGGLQRNHGRYVACGLGLSRQYNAVVKSLIFKGLQRFAAMLRAL
jgi:hypothetical protein